MFQYFSDKYFLILIVWIESYQLLTQCRHPSVNVWSTVLFNCGGSPRTTWFSWSNNVAHIGYGNLPVATSIFVWKKKRIQKIREIDKKWHLGKIWIIWISKIYRFQERRKYNRRELHLFALSLLNKSSFVKQIKNIKTRQDKT